ncbi:MAG: DinB family protein [Pyrinomonadaceae bacterium]|nr:DinB family protein [Pyrinomonadaceae bacterium]
MNFEHVADVYAANAAARTRLVITVSELSGEQADLPTENGKWTVSGIVEHLAKVGDGMSRICYKLLSKAEEEGKTSDGTINLSANFIDGVKKLATEKQRLEAPEVVQPGGSQSIEESLENLKNVANQLDAMRPLFETVDGSELRFPHPYFGPMSAQDWLVLLGLHETRHTDQIERILGTTK